MTRVRTFVAPLAVVSLAMAPAAAACADTFTETFTNGINTAGWSYGGNERIEAAGGNPGAYLHTSELDTFAPQLWTEPGRPSNFTGDYRARQVTSIGIDLKTFHVDFSAEDRPLTLILVHDNNTPVDFDDDYGFYFMGPNIPLVGEGWLSYEFEIPSQAAQPPQGWRPIELGFKSPEPDWNALIKNVRRVQFFYGDPEMFFIFQMWEVGADNISITSVPQSDATLTGLNVLRGTLMSGGLPELAESDNQSLRVKSGFGSTFTELHSMVTDVTANTTVSSPTTLGLTIEARVSHTSGIGRLRLLNHNTTQYDQVGQFALSGIDTTHAFSGIAAANYVSGGGDITVQVRTTVVVPIFAFTYDTFIDHLRITVN
ncbi:MAG: hypothetical protein HRU76_08210 [Phycisphaeraceae bacterium]|nr:MAG: hypothetical protein HRU76_08210 [Phycisphaeraceae bacterium]